MMNTEVKSAWFSVGVISITLISFLILGRCLGFPPAFGSFALLALLGLAPVLFRKKEGVMDCDERDREVIKKATLVGGVFSYLSVVLGGMVLWLVQVLKQEAVMSIHWLPALVALAAMVLYFTRSVFIISQYTPGALGSDD